MMRLIETLLSVIVLALFAVGTVIYIGAIWLMLAAVLTWEKVLTLCRKTSQN